MTTTDEPEQSHDMDAGGPDSEIEPELTERELLTQIIEHVTGRSLDPYALLTRDEAAAHLRCTKQYISALTSAGKLHTVRIGKRVLVPRADLEAFIRGEPARETDGRWPGTGSLFDSGDTP